jgi:Flp pilus assembly protein TadD
MARPASTDAYNQWGNFLYGTGRYEEARQKHQIGLDLNAADTSIRTALAWDLLGLERFAEAESQFKEVIRLNPHAWGALSGWGTLLARQGYMPEATTKWMEAAELNPASTYPYSAWADALYAHGQYQEASEKYELALQRNPTDKIMRDNLKAALTQLKH